MNAFRLLVSLLLTLGLFGRLAGAESPEAAALAVLGSSADLHAKARACQELGVYGGPASVTALAALLDDEKLGDYARSGLEGIADPSAAKALRNALRTLKDRRLAGAVNSLGVRRDRAAVGDLRALALEPARGVAAEALSALGQIASADAARVLEDVLARGAADLRAPAAQAALVAGELLAKEGNPSAARKLLDAIVRARPSEHLVSVAQLQLGALKTKR